MSGQRSVKRSVAEKDREPGTWVCVLRAGVGGSGQPALSGRLAWGNALSVAVNFPRRTRREDRPKQQQHLPFIPLPILPPPWSWTQAGSTGLNPGLS